MRTRVTFDRCCALLALAALLTTGLAHADTPAKGPLKVFILAGQSNMDGQAHVRTIIFWVRTWIRPVPPYSRSSSRTAPIW